MLAYQFTVPPSLSHLARVLPHHLRRCPKGPRACQCQGVRQALEEMGEGELDPDGGREERREGGREGQSLAASSKGNSFATSPKAAYVKTCPSLLGFSYFLTPSLPNCPRSLHDAITSPYRSCTSASESIPWLILPPPALAAPEANVEDKEDGGGGRVTAPVATPVAAATDPVPPPPPALRGPILVRCMPPRDTPRAPSRSASSWPCRATPVKRRECVRAWK